MSMRSIDFEQAWKAITPIEAQSMLIQFQVAAYPHMSKHKQETLHRKISKQAYPERFEKPVTLTLKQLSKVLNGR